MFVLLHKIFYKSYILIVISVLILCKQASAQTPVIDNLKKVLPSLKDSARIDCLNDLASEFSDRYWSKSAYQQTDTALMYTSLAMAESEKLNYQKGIGRAFQNFGYIREEHGNFIAAEDYTRKALVILRKENIKAQYSRAQIFLGFLLHNRGFFSESIALYKQGLPYYIAINDSEHIAAIYRVIARAYISMGNSEYAFTYFQKDFAIQKNPSDSWGKRSTATLKAAVYMAAGDTANAVFYYKQAALVSKDQHAILGAYYSNMAIAYSLQKKLDSALLQVQQKISLIQSSNEDSLYRKAALMISYFELTNAFFATKKLDSAIKYSKQPLNFFKDSGYTVYLMPLLKTVANIYNKKRENTTALLYTKSLLTSARKSGARPLIRDAYKLLWQIYTDEHKINVADAYHLKYILLNDSLQNDKYISQAAAWKAINDINTNEANYRNQLSITETRNNARIKYISNEKKLQLYIFIAAFVFIALLTIIIIRNSRLKRKKDQLQLMITEANVLLEKQKREQEVTQLNQQKTELELKALRAQMNPHFIFNCLNSINRFIITNDAKKASDYLTKFAKLIRIVLEQSGKSFVSLEDEVACLKLYMDLEALRFEKPFHYKIDLNGTDVSSVMIPTMLIQPFVENAIWHGLHPKQNGTGEININIHQQDNILQCCIYDNGVGIKNLNGTIQQDKKSLGISITKQRLQLANNNNEEIKIEVQALKDESGENTGTNVNLNIPVTCI